MSPLRFFVRFGETGRDSIEERAIVRQRGIEQCLSAAGQERSIADLGRRRRNRIATRRFPAKSPPRGTKKFVSVTTPTSDPPFCPHAKNRSATTGIPIGHWRMPLISSDTSGEINVRAGFC
jgi:hypothetical protein